MKKWGMLFLGVLFSVPALASGWQTWESFSVPRGGNEPRWVCGMSSVNTANPTENVSIKLIESVPFIQFDLYKKAWSFPEGSPVKVVLAFDDAKPFKVTAYGDGQFVSIAVPVEETTVFLTLLNGRKQAHIFFMGSHEKDWSIDLNGASASLMKMLSCYEQNRALQRGTASGS